MRDLDFDPPAPARPGSPGADLRPYQRLVVNPFLALLGLGAWAAIARAAPGGAGAGSVPVLAGLVALVGALPLLVQFHCRDCGATGPLLRWRRHACSTVLRRVAEGRPRRFHGPSPPVQLALWIYFLLCLLVILSATGWMPVRSWGHRAG